MKNIANIIILALVVSLMYTTSKNYMLIKNISFMHEYINASADRLKTENDVKENYTWNRAKLMDKTVFKYQNSIDNFTDKGKLKDHVFKKINEDYASWTQFLLELERRTKLNEFTKSSISTNTFKTMSVHPRVDFTDELHIGYQENILDNCRYEVYINGYKKENNANGTYQCRTAPKLLIDLYKIFINPENQQLDTLCVSKMISRA